MSRTTLTGKDFAIGVLGVTAVILFTSLVILHALTPQQALATGQGGVTGDYVVSTTRVDAHLEAVMVVDTVAQRMNMYAFIPDRNTIELCQQFDLRALEVGEQGVEEGERGQGRGNRRNP